MTDERILEPSCIGHWCSRSLFSFLHRSDLFLAFYCLLKLALDSAMRKGISTSIVLGGHEWSTLIKSLQSSEWRSALLSKKCITLHLTKKTLRLLLLCKKKNSFNLLTFLFANNKNCNLEQTQKRKWTLKWHWLMD